MVKRDPIGPISAGNKTNRRSRVPCALAILALLIEIDAVRIRLEISDCKPPAHQQRQDVFDKRGFTGTGIAAYRDRWHRIIERYSAHEQISISGFARDKQATTFGASSFRHEIGEHRF